MSGKTSSTSGKPPREGDGHSLVGLLDQWGGGEGNNDVSAFAAFAEDIGRIETAMADDPVQWIDVTTMRPDDEVRRLSHAIMAKVARHTSALSWDSPLGALLLPELGGFWGSVYNLPSQGQILFPSGSSEAILLALYNARQRARSRGMNGPLSVIRPTSGHTSIDKACALLQLEVRQTPLDEGLRCDLAALESMIDGSTIAIVGAIPTDCHGACDDIVGMAAIAEARDIWLHVDGALGGCLAPFARELGNAIPQCDFTVPGVTSVGIGLHKYGFAPIGIAALMYRDAQEAAPGQFDLAMWDGAAMTSDRIAGMRSLDSVAGAWAVSRLLGRDGYRRRAEAVVHNQAAFARMVESVEGVSMVCEPTLGIATFNADDPSLSNFGTTFYVRGNRGKPIQRPGGFVVCIGPRMGPNDLDVFADELRATLKQCATA